MGYYPRHFIRYAPGTFAKMQKRIQRLPVVETIAPTAVGQPVRVVNGNTIPRGTEGVIFWIGETQYGTRVGIEAIDGDKFFIAAKHVTALADAIGMPQRDTVNANKFNEEPPF